MFSHIKEILKKYDFSYFLGIIAIFLLGFINLYSAANSKFYPSGMPIYQLQLIWFGVSLIAGFSISFIHPKNLFRYSFLIYFINIVLLILVFVMGQKGMGAQRWLAIGPFRLQPSEMMKISVVLALARWFTNRSPDKEIGFKEMITPFIISFVPAVLIIKQPDLGTGLLILLIFAVMIFYRRLKVRTILILCMLGVIGGPIMYKFGLKDYQRKRIITFLDPTADARGSGYNAIQSEIAIGSGKLFGKGFKKSSQASLNYLPENHTDFVFSVFSEEHGFFGALVLIVLFAIFFLRLLSLSTVVLKFYDSVVVIGILAIFFWHTIINIGMVTGLMPIVGLPLPLVSYGGSSLLTFGICTGIITSISNTKNIF